MKKRLGKKMVMLLASATLLLGAVTYGKASCTVHGTLKTTVYPVSIIKDSATAVTSVTNGGDSTKKVKAETTVYVYDSNGKCVQNSSSAQGAAAVEGTSAGAASASIYNMKRAKGIHRGKNGTVASYVSTNTYWNK